MHERYLDRSSDYGENCSMHSDTLGIHSEYSVCPKFRCTGFAVVPVRSGFVIFTEHDGYFDEIALISKSSLFKMLSILQTITEGIVLGYDETNKRAYNLYKNTKYHYFKSNTYGTGIFQVTVEDRVNKNPLVSLSVLDNLTHSYHKQYTYRFDLSYAYAMIEIIGKCLEINLK